MWPATTSAVDLPKEAITVSNTCIGKTDLFGTMKLREEVLCVCEILLRTHQQEPSGSSALNSKKEE